MLYVLSDFGAVGSDALRGVHLGDLRRVPRRLQPQPRRHPAARAGDGGVGAGRARDTGARPGRGGTRRAPARPTRRPVRLGRGRWLAWSFIAACWAPPSCSRGACDHLVDHVRLDRASTSATCGRSLRTSLLLAGAAAVATVAAGVPRGRSGRTSSRTAGIGALEGATYVAHALPGHRHRHLAGVRGRAPAAARSTWSRHCWCWATWCCSCRWRSVPCARRSSSRPCGWRRSRDRWAGPAAGASGGSPRRWRCRASRPARRWCSCRR